MYLFLWYTVTHILHIPADVIHVCVAKKNASKVFLTDSGHAFGVGEELNLKHLRLQVVHEPGGEKHTLTETMAATSETATK